MSKSQRSTLPHDFHVFSHASYILRCFNMKTAQLPKIPLYMYIVYICFACKLTIDIVFPSFPYRDYLDSRYFDSYSQQSSIDFRASPSAHGPHGAQGRPCLVRPDLLDVHLCQQLQSQLPLAHALLSGLWIQLIRGKKK